MTLLRLTGPHWCKEPGPSNKETGLSNKETGPSNKETGPSNKETGPSSKETGPPCKEETGVRGPAWLSQYSPSLPKVALVPDQATGGTLYTWLLYG